MENMDTTDVNTADINCTNVGATTVGRTTSVINRFYRPEAPSAMMDMDINGDQDDLEDDVNMRQNRVDTLKVSRVNAKTRAKRSDAAYREFLSLSDRFLVADNCRNPSEEQTEVINTLQTSVSTIVLVGDEAAGNARQQTANRIQKRLSELKNQSDKDQKEWDSLCSEYENARTALKTAKKNLGVENSQPIVDGRMIFCPFRGGTMTRPSRDIIIEIWSQICGPQMLDLEFTKLLNCVRDLRASLSAETRFNKPGEINQILLIFITNFFFPDTLAYKAAHAIQAPVERVLDDMNVVHSRAESKRKWIDSLVSFV